MAAAHLVGVTVSMRVMSAGDGYRYLLKTVAAGDGARDLSTPLTRYYTQTGTPSGSWLGSGLSALGKSGGGRLAAGDVVSEGQLRLLLGQGRDPMTGRPLGRAYPVYQDAGGGVPRRRAVAGFDYTFSVPKSVSTLWAIADAATQATIARAHHAAVRDVIALMEREVAATRTGSSTTDGAVAQVAVHGLLATGFDHYDSRSGDPQLHTHVVVSNKVQAVHDGKWRALDGRPMHAATVALSEHYRAVLADHLTRALGVAWEQRARGRDRNPGWEIAGMPQQLLEEFSTRSRDINSETRQLIDDYVAQHGRRPSPTAIIKLRAQATLATRPDKQVRSLSDSTVQWRQRADEILGRDPTQWAHRLLEDARNTPDRGNLHEAAATSAQVAGMLVRAGQFSAEDVAALAKRTLAAVGEKRATWRRWNLHAEASRQIMGIRFATTVDRDAIVGAITDAAEEGSVRLTPPEAATSPVEFQRPDGTSVFRPRYGEVFTSAELLAAEGRLLESGRDRVGPGMDARMLDLLVRRNPQWQRLGDDQQAAATAIATSGRKVDVLVGPAGTGKTTTIRALRQIWENRHGSGSVIGLAPSAAAADVLAHELGIGTENTAKWAFEHRRGRWDLRPGQLVVVDEASLAGTFTLEAIAAHAAEAGAKVLLVGDPHQLNAVEAGGAFGMLVDDRRTCGDQVPALAAVRRFHHRWEQTASLRLRIGDVSVVDAYLGHDRIRDGDTQTITDAIFLAWKQDVDAGRTSLMVAETHETVTELNQRARADRINARQVHPDRGVQLSGGTEASAGDVVSTRRNDRRLHAGNRWVRNGDRWQITHIRGDGSIRARRLSTGGKLGASVTLPADYVAANVELGYAATIHRAQGATVDTAHLLVASPSMTREALYVAMTRGRSCNIAYIATDHPDLEEHQRHADTPVTARSILTGILHHPGAETSAHQTRGAERERYASIAQLAAEYDTIATQAQKPRWTQLLHDSGLGDQQVRDVVGSDAYGPLAAQLRRAETDGHNPDRLVPEVVARHQLDNADDIAAVIHHRIAHATARPPTNAASSRSTRRPPGLIAGLIPAAAGPMTNAHREALIQRQELMEQRAATLLRTALNEPAPWLRSLGRAPNEPQYREAWLRQARTIVAYRDRHNITDTDRILGTEPTSESQQTDANRARSALHRAQALTSNNASAFGAADRTSPEQTGPRL